MKRFAFLMGAMVLLLLFVGLVSLIPGVKYQSIMNGAILGVVLGNFYDIIQLEKN